MPNKAAAAIPSKSASAGWVSILDVFSQWRDRLGSDEDAKDALETFLRDGKTRSAKRWVDAAGEEISGPFSILNTWFWQELAHLELATDANGVDHLVVNHTDPADIYLEHQFPGGHWEYLVRRIDVERWQGLYWALAAPSPPPPSPPPKITNAMIDDHVRSCFELVDGVWQPSATQAACENAWKAKHGSAARRRVRDRYNAHAKKLGITVKEGRPEKLAQ
jgi:hypothetical protein